MITNRKLIESKSLLAAFVLSLCLAIPALCTAASPAHLAARADHRLLASYGLVDDPPEIIIPKPPPAALPGTTAMEQTA